MILRENERVIREAHLRAKRILTQKRSLLEKIAQTLIKQETLEREEFERVIGKKLPPTTKNKAA